MIDEYGEVCFYRPKRKLRRLYTATDVARIFCHATNQGVTRTDIKRKIREKCGSQDDDDCTCERMLAELLQAQKTAALAIAIITMLIPYGRIAKKIVEYLKKYRIMREEAKRLEDLSKQIDELEKNTKPILEGEYERILQEQAEIAARIDIGVVIKP